MRVQPLRRAFQGTVAGRVAQGLAAAHRSLAVSRGAVTFSECLSSVLCGGNDGTDRVVCFGARGSPLRDGWHRPPARSGQWSGILAVAPDAESKIVKTLRTPPW